MESKYLQKNTIKLSLKAMRQQLLLTILKDRKSEKDLLLNSRVFSHACKTPLTVLLCSLEATLKDKKHHTPQIEQSLEAAKKIRQLLNHLTNNSSPNDQLFYVGQAVSEVSNLVKVAHPTAIITINISASMQLLGPKLYFQEAIECLLTNALESYRSGQKARIAISARTRRQNIQLDIVDSGKGMSLLEMQLSKVNGITFKKNGDGIGVTTTNIIIKKYFSGTVRIATCRGVGTRVSIFFPLVNHAVAEPSDSFELA